MLPTLKALRAEYGLSQKALAQAIGITQQSVNSFENHDVSPSYLILLKLADFFDTSIDYLVGRTDIRRRIEYTSEFKLNEREASVIKQYRVLSEKEKACIDLMLQTLSEK